MDFVSLESNSDRFLIYCSYRCMRIYIKIYMFHLSLDSNCPAHSLSKHFSCSILAVVPTIQFVELINESSNVCLMDAKHMQRKVMAALKTIAFKVYVTSAYRMMIPGGMGWVAEDLEM